ncbi:MAG: rod shape-determining protein [Bacteroidia bacterium]|nr:rod shape-determining protein [Bacteroidia bacterium]
MFGLLLRQDIAIDLGTANTVIMIDGEVVIDEPSIVAIDQAKNRVITVGQEALYMHEKAHKNIRTVRPLRGGVIADFAMAEAMIRGFLAKVPGSRRLFKPNLRLMVCIPSGITEVEERAVRDSAERAGAREVYLIHEPMAAALGMDLDVEAPEGNMVIDIGGGTTEIAVITLGGIVCDRSIRIAGDELNADIVEYIRRQHNLQIGERTAERIKIEIGAAIANIPDPPPNQSVRGKDIMTGTPRTLSISYREIVNALDKSIAKILEAVMQTLGSTPPEIAADLVERGIHMAGGGSLLRGLDQRISQQTHLPVRIAEDPLRAIAKGTSFALRNLHKFHFLLVKS